MVAGSFRWLVRRLVHDGAIVRMWIWAAARLRCCESAGSLWLNCVEAGSTLHVGSDVDMGGRLFAIFCGGRFILA